MLLTVDIGNSSIVLSFFGDSPEVRERLRLGTDERRTADEYAGVIRSLSLARGIDPGEVRTAVLSCVVPVLAAPLSDAVRQVFPSLERLVPVGPGMRTGFIIRTENPSEVGSDLVADAACAVKEYPLPLLVADLGTMSVLMLINENSEFTGTVIFPGVQTVLRSTAESAAQLPELSVGTCGPEAVPLLGRNTAASIRAGALWANAMWIDAYVERLEHETGKTLNLVATGGLAGTVIPFCRHGFRVDPDLTAKGLYYLGTAPQKRLSARPGEP
ncbi:MAG: type III pantothenate kinase [Clostridia bacterium]|nr:type III pantothenate kinase [Clostridia bacterium]